MAKRDADSRDSSVKVSVGVAEVAEVVPAIRKEVHQSFPGKPPEDGGHTVTVEVVNLPTLVAIRQLESDPSVRSDDPRVAAAIRMALAGTSASRKAPKRSSDNLFASCNSLAPSRSAHLHQAREPGPVVPYVVAEPSNHQAGSSSLPTPSPSAHPNAHAPNTNPRPGKSKQIQRKKRQDERRLAAKKYNSQTAQNVQATKVFLFSNLRVTHSGWMGTYMPSGKLGKEKEKVVAAWKTGKILTHLLCFVRVPFVEPTRPGVQPHTYFRDAEGRLFAVRSSLPAFMVDDLLEKLADAVVALMSETQVDPERRRTNNRGLHLFTLYGYDRQISGMPKVPGFEAAGSNGPAFWKHWDPDHSPLKRASYFVNSLLRLHFPGIALRMEEVNRNMALKYGLISPFGYFWNFCINAPSASEGIHRVFCQPHIDAKNGALLVCAVLVYYYGKVPKERSGEHVWLVLWEAGLIIEVPAGVVILYPSALFLHFNVDIRDLDRVQLVVTQGEAPPTQESAVPLCTGNSEEGGRASMVWFTQASILQSADLPSGCHTVQQAKEMERKAQKENPREEPYYVATYDALNALEKGLFPVKNYLQ